MTSCVFSEFLAVSKRRRKAWEAQKAQNPKYLRAEERTSPGASQKLSALFSLSSAVNSLDFRFFRVKYFHFFPEKGSRATFPPLPPAHLSLRTTWSCCWELFSLLCPSFSCSPCFPFPPSCPSLHCPSSPSFLVLLDDSHPSRLPERQHFNAAATHCQLLLLLSHHSSFCLYT